MILGHFGVAMAAKRVAPRTSLGTLFAAAQLADLLWPLLVLTGIEEVRIAPGIAAASPLDFVWYPWSHSLAMLVVWGVVAALAYAMFTRKTAGAVMIAMLVISHWVLDFIVHRPDLPLTPGGSLRMGLSLWRSVPATIAVELIIFVAGIVVYAHATRARDRVGSVGAWLLVLALAGAYLASAFGAPPASAHAVAWSALGMWLFVLWGAWVDRHRRSVSLPETPRNSSTAPQAQT
ncbi:MAG TPA: hypothetical protein VFK13_06260 [Gemmatimonadaceae bacterium]|nr:hypothetical protein [Gemmatimonadaceae bacterium]